MKDFLEDFDPIQWWLLILLPVLIGISGYAVGQAADQPALGVVAALLVGALPCVRLVRVPVMAYYFILTIVLVPIILLILPPVARPWLGIPALILLLIVILWEWAVTARDERRLGYLRSAVGNMPLAELVEVIGWLRYRSDGPDEQKIVELLQRNRDQAIPTIIDAFQRARSPSDRCELLKYLARLPDAQTTTFLTRLLRASIDNMVLAAAANACGKLGDEAFVNPLLALAKHADGAQPEAIKALARIGTTASDEFLLNTIVTENDTAIVSSAIEGYSQAGVETGLPLLKQLVQRWQDRPLGRQAVVAIAAIGTPGALDFIKHLLNDECDEERIKYLDESGQGIDNGEAAAQWLLDLVLQQANTTTRREAGRVLWLMFDDGQIDERTRRRVVSGLREKCQGGRDERQQELGRLADELEPMLDGWHIRD